MNVKKVRKANKRVIRAMIALDTALIIWRKVMNEEMDANPEDWMDEIASLPDFERERLFQFLAEGK